MKQAALTWLSYLLESFRSRLEVLPACGSPVHSLAYRSFYAIQGTRLTASILGRTVLRFILIRRLSTLDRRLHSARALLRPMLPGPTPDPWDFNILQLSREP